MFEFLAEEIEIRISFIGQMHTYKEFDFEG